tara:strand:- start:2822 stop:3829 length:1008 start_codon:yes stop_codon:yes gene_type:complete
MPIKKLICILALFISSFVYTKEYVIGFGSCIDQDLPQPIWSAIEAKNVDAFMFLGDNVYGDHPSGKLDKLRKSYISQSTKLPKWLNKKKVVSIWDDHDYGINDGGGDFKNKRESQKLFLDFWQIPENDPRHKRDGLYFNELIEIDGFKINLIVLDTRFFRSKLSSNKSPYIPTDNIDTTILGDEQWTWFKQVLNHDSDLILVLSSIQILATEHVFEKWDLFPHERLKMMKLLDSIETKSLIISGDRHKGGLYKKGSLIELTSSSLNKPTTAARISRNLPIVADSIKKQLLEDDKLLQNKIYNYENFGLIKINTKTQKIEISLNDINGNEVFADNL